MIDQKQRVIQTVNIRSIQFVLLFLLANMNLWGQNELFGITSDFALTGEKATIYRTSGDGLISVMSFGPIASGPRFTNLLVANGKFWGMTSEGGANDNGIIFTADLDGQNIERIHAFNGTDGSIPYHSLIEYNGRIWGLTSAGGDNGHGVIFSMDLNGQDFQVSHHFNGTSGRDPRGSLYVSNGKLWGLTRKGGQNGYGVIFNYDPATKSYAAVHNFIRDDGANPYRNMTEFNGRLYGVAYDGGTDGYGVIFSISNDESDFQVEHSFDGLLGWGVWGQPVLYNDVFIGGTQWGGTVGAGVIYTFDPVNKEYEVIHNFSDESGYSVECELLVHNDKIWGITTPSGNISSGTIFSLKPDGTEFRYVVDLDDHGASSTDGGLILSDNLLWGLLNIGESSSIFSINPQTDEFLIRDGFASISAEGTFSPLVLHKNRLYGTASYGGEGNDGVLFSILRNGKGLRIEYEFNDDDGVNPLSVILHEDKLLGITQTGGQFSKGAIFSYDLFTGDYNIIYNFEDRDRPNGELLVHNGKIYGTNNGNRSSLYSVNFDGTDFDQIGTMTEPNGYLTLYKDHVWGNDNTFNGGRTFRYSPETDQLVYTRTFLESELYGSKPAGRLLVHDDRLWGVTKIGGVYNSGVIYSREFDPNTYEVIHQFDISNGKDPSSGLIFHNGKFWGNTRLGGTDDKGVIFSLDTDGTGFQKEYDLTGDFKSPWQYMIPSPLKLNHYLTLEDVEPVTYGDAPFQINTTSESDYTIDLSSDAVEVISIDEKTATIVSAGIATISAEIQEDDDYLGERLEIEITVNKLQQEIQIQAIPEVSWLDEGFEILAESNSKNDILILSSNENIVTIQDNSYGKVQGVGRVTITASQPEDGNHLAGITDIQVDVIGPVLNIDKEPELTIYPNPTDGTFRISTVEDIRQLKIVDLKGNLVKQLVPTSTLFKLKGSIPRGMYLITANLQDGSYVLIGRLLLK